MRDNFEKYLDITQNRRHKLAYTNLQSERYKKFDRNLGKYVSYSRGRNMLQTYIEYAFEHMPSCKGLGFNHLSPIPQYLKINFADGSQLFCSLTSPFAEETMFYK